MKKIILMLLLSNFQSLIAQNEDKIEDYERNSLYTLMVTKPGREYEDEIKTFFTEKFVPDKFNDHNLSARTISGSRASSRKEELDNIVNYLNTNKIAHQLIAKWFNRSEKGGFNLDLLQSRSFYNAQFKDIIKAKNSLRGVEGIGDLGTSLIDNTFIIVLDSRYTNKEEVAGIISAGIGSFLSSANINVGTSLALQATDLGVNTFGKGYVVSTEAHLFKLFWNKEVETRFLEELWATDETITPEKKKAFDNADFFYIDYIGTEKSTADVQSTNLSGKSNSELIGRATIKSIDNVISKLQKEYDIFKTKAPIYSVDPITCKIGLKEGLSKKTKFEILEKVMDDNGNISLYKVGTAKVDTKYEIWDNRYGADEENQNQNVDVTHLKLTSGKDIQPGMLIKQIK